MGKQKRIHHHPGPKRNCKICRAAYMRKHRQIVGLTPEQRRRMNARSYVHVYVKRGKIEKRPCFICLTTKSIECHHEDYSMPLKTLWLCHRHHVMVTFKRLSLLPAAVYQFWEQEKVSRIASDLVGMER